VAYLARPAGGADGAASPAARRLRSWAKQLGDALDRVSAARARPDSDRRRTIIRRGPLKGAGQWTHQYANAANTACGDDRLVRAPLGVLWFGEPGPGRMPSRHSSNTAPLAIGGKMIVQGEDVVAAYDAYNGLELWKREMPGASRLGMKYGASNLAADDESVFVVIQDTCHRLDLATGRTLRTYKLPPKGTSPRSWGYVARAGDLLYGSAANRVFDDRGNERIYAINWADCLFAVDIATGEPRWRHEVDKIWLNTVCIGGGRMYFVDRKVTPAQRAEAMKGITHVPRRDRHGKLVGPDVRLVTAVDARTGREAWSRPLYVSDCVQIGAGGGDLTAMYADEVLLLCAQPWNGHFWKEFFSGEFSRRSLIALAGDSGRQLWSGHKGYRSRPLIVGKRIIAEPWAHDLKTGAEIMRTHPVTGQRSKWQIARPGHHCGNIAAGPNMLFFRSGTTAHYDLLGDCGTAHFGAHRPGCWINCIPANGVVVMPEASSGCMCPYSLMCTVVFRPGSADRAWGMFSAPGPMTPVKRLAINFGAPGDRRDSSGRLWLAYPRPRQGRLVLDLRLAVQTAKGGGYFADNADFLSVAGTKDAWIYASGCTGLTRCRIPLAKAGSSPADYTVRLHFAGRDGAKPGRCVFDVTCQGKVVVKDLDVVEAAGGPGRALVRTFGVRAGEALALELVPKTNNPTPADTPFLNGIEIIADRR